MRNPVAYSEQPEAHRSRSDRAKGFRLSHTTGHADFRIRRLKPA